MPEVRLREGEGIEEALRRFKRECEKENVLQEIRKREFFVPPALKRKQKLAEAKRRARRRRLY